MRYGPVEPISSAHRTSSFDCGSDEQTLWLRRHALQAHRSDSASVRVVTLSGERSVLGYYALAAGSVAATETPARVTHGLGQYPVPVVVLTRLGVDVSEQGHGLGVALVRDALLRVAGAAEEIGARALLLHCENEASRSFYLHLASFEPSPADDLQLFLLLGDLRRTLRGA